MQLEFFFKIEIENVTMNKKQVPNSMTISIPRLSSNPSRVDRLIVEAFREFNKTTSLISKLDNLTGTIFTLPIQNLISSWLERIYSVQAKRKEELVNGLEREKLGQPLRFNDDAGNLIDDLIVKLFSFSFNFHYIIQKLFFWRILLMN